MSRKITDEEFRVEHLGEFYTLENRFKSFCHNRPLKAYGTRIIPAILKFKGSVLGGFSNVSRGDKMFYLHGFNWTINVRADYDTMTNYIYFSVPYKNIPTHPDPLVSKGIKLFMEYSNKSFKEIPGDIKRFITQWELYNAE